MRAETSTIWLARDAAGGESSARSGSIGSSQESRTQVRPDGVLQDRISGLVGWQQITYHTYDPAGRRIAKDVDGELTKCVAACPFGELRASSEPTEWDADDTLLRKFIHDPTIDGMNSADTLECWSVKKRTTHGILVSHLRTRIRSTRISLTDSHLGRLTHFALQLNMVSPDIPRFGGIDSTGVESVRREGPGAAVTVCDYLVARTPVGRLTCVLVVLALRLPCASHVTSNYHGLDLRRYVYERAKQERHVLACVSGRHLDGLLWPDGQRCGHSERVR